MTVQGNAKEHWYKDCLRALRVIDARKQVDVYVTCLAERLNRSLIDEYYY